MEEFYDRAAALAKTRGKDQENADWQKEAMKAVAGLQRGWQRAAADRAAMLNKKLQGGVDVRLLRVLLLSLGWGEVCAGHEAESGDVALGWQEGQWRRAHLLEATEDWTGAGAFVWEFVHIL